jgi:predicted glycosyltransferase
MRILVDITHPMHAHFFRHALARWRNEGHALCVTSRNKDITWALLDEFGLEHIRVGRRARRGVGGLAVELVERAWGLRQVVRSFRPDVAAAEAGTFLVYGCLPERVPVVVFSDTEHARVANAITYPLTSAVITPRAYQKAAGSRHIRYDGYQQLAYTHPAYFTPDPAALEAEGLRPGEPFVIVRLVNWGASHDVGDYGVRDLRAVIAALTPHGRIILSAEKPLPPDLQALALRGPRRNMLHLQAFARLFLGESATMAAECAMLGTPAIFLSTSRRGYIEELERRYEMVYAFHDPQTGQAAALAKAQALLADPATPSRWEAKRARMMAELVDVSDLIARTVPQYARGQRA